MIALQVIAALLAVLTATAGAQRLSASPLAAGELPWNASITIGHAGEGGLYAELVQDRSFDALATATGFLSSRADRLAVDLPALAAAHRNGTASIHAAWEPQQTTYTSKSNYLRERAAANADPRNDIIIAWQALPGTNAILTKDIPLNDHNPVSMELTSGGHAGTAGIFNYGYWGVSVVAGTSYTASIFIRSPDPLARNVTVSLLSADLSTFYANLTLWGVAGGWRKYGGELVPAASDTDARLAVLFDGPGTIIIDSVSLFPTANVEKGLGMTNPWPFRQDLLEALKALKPAFMRFPGGCYIEGDWLRNAFYWKQAVGANEARPGHMNGVWGYWSTDGLGLFEYMLLVEELGTEPVWVINNGVAHGDSVRGADVMPLVQDALDSLEFISGPPDSQACDCGKPYYLNSYLAFFGAIRARYPHMRLVANCDMGADAPTDLWDWHVYTNPTDMFNRRHDFDGKTPQNSHYIFASEYAVTDGGGWGNLIGAVSEAAFMTGLERNSEVVVLAAYAPLFVHTNNRPWPTNMIVIDNYRWFGIPSYHVQQMFRAAQGTHYLPTSVLTNPSTEARAAERVHEEKVAASATCQDAACSVVALKIVNFSSYHQASDSCCMSAAWSVCGEAVSLVQGRIAAIAVRMVGLASAAVVDAQGELVFLTSGHPEDENTFVNPRKVFPAARRVDGLSSSFLLPVDPWSVNVLQLHLAASPSGSAAVEVA
eukprot:scaffold1.g5257.t1